jgi:hypothetical protein
MPDQSPEGHVRQVFNSGLGNPSASDGQGGGSCHPTEAEQMDAKSKHSRDMENIVAPRMTQPITGMPDNNHPK